MDNIPPAFALNTAFTQNKIGAAFGAGLEWRFDHHWSLRGEYLFVMFSGMSAPDQFQLAAGGPTGFFLQHQANFYEQIGRVALSYKFDGWGKGKAVVASY